MDSSLSSPSPDTAEVTRSTKEVEEMENLLHVDSFLIEALENPRHRLTVLRMELDVQKFIQSSDQSQFEFQHFPTSYLRCAAHRVAQHYGLQTLVIENIAEGPGSRIIVRKTPESKYPSICLSDIPTKQPENGQAEQVKIFIRPRPSRASQSNAGEHGNKIISRAVEKRQEDYDKARARIFNGSLTADNGFVVTVADGGDDSEVCREELERMGVKDAAYRVAIFRDREKDRTDPDYDRSYDRYARGLAHSNNFAHGACTMLQPPHMIYEGGFSPMCYRPADPSALNAFGTAGCSQPSPSAIYVQWPTPTMVYAQTYEHFRHAAYQAPAYQQALGFAHF